MWEPFGSAPAHGTAFWRGSPNERGTLNILSICIITLLLCAYTSLHLDIPKYGKAGWIHQFWRRLLWVCVGLAAPEFVAFIAFRQMLFARSLDYKMHELTKSLLSNARMDPSRDIEGATSRTTLESDIPLIGTHGHASADVYRTDASLDRTNAWSRVHSHFALMGGFVFEAKRTHATILDADQKRLTLTPVALRKIAVNAPSLLPDLSKEGIRDKSKANGLAKFLVCVQAIWFIAQTIGRLVTDLPISLLEMNTLLHAFCCLFIYLAWWHKPLDIEEPHVINIADDHAGKVCAWMMVKDTQHQVLLTSINDRGNERTLHPSHLRLVYEDDLDVDLDATVRADDHKVLMLEQISWSKEHNTRRQRPNELTQNDYTSAKETKKGNSGEHCVKLREGQKVHGFILYDSDAKGPKRDRDPTMYTRLSMVSLERLRLAQILRREDGAANAWHFGDQSRAFRYENKLLARGTSIADLSSPDESLKQWRRPKSITPNSVLLTGLLLAGSLYGGIHLFAWNGPFPSGIERMLWRISCLIIASPVALVLLAVLVWCFVFLLLLIVQILDVCMPIKRLLRWLWDPIDIFLESDRGNVVLTLICVGILGILALVYAAARTYLVVECFINIAHLPDAVFQEPNWSQYIPHFGAG